jgi:hypothetical protein
MAEYKETHGGKVKNYESDPDNPYVGQVWYNEELSSLRIYATTNSSAWATGGNVNTARGFTAASGNGTQNANIVFGGSPDRTETESYDGTSWTEVNDLNTGRTNPGGAGTQTAALCFAGSEPRLALNESWNGTSWTETGDLNTARRQPGGSGTTTSALAYGGEAAPGETGVTESWNGSSWTEVNDLNTVRALFQGCGTDNTTALAAGGNAPPSVANTEVWNGTSWFEVNDINTTRSRQGFSGNATDGLIFGGSASPRQQTELWNGAVWAEQNDMSQSRQYLSGAGTQPSAIAISGQTSPGGALESASEEWDADFGHGTWVTGGNMNTARGDIGSAGTQTSALGYGGTNGWVAVVHQQLR